MIFSTREAHGSCANVNINGTGEIQFGTARPHAVGHLDLDVKGEATIMSPPTRSDAGWCGLHLSGTIHPNAHLGFGFINELDQSTKLLRCDDWID